MLRCLFVELGCWVRRMVPLLMEIERVPVLKDAVECFIVAAAEQGREHKKRDVRLMVVK